MAQLLHLNGFCVFLKYVTIWIIDKLHEKKMNDLYKSPNGKCLEKFESVKKFELVECRTVH